MEQVRAIGSDNSFLSSITIGEFVYGIQRLPDSHKRDELEAWLFELKRSHADHILPFDAETAHIWGELVAKGEATGRVLPIQDTQIAATVIQHGLRLMIRNTAVFVHTGVMLINPWVVDSEKWNTD